MLANVDFSECNSYDLRLLSKADRTQLIPDFLKTLAPKLPKQFMRQRMYNGRNPKALWNEIQAIFNMPPSHMEEEPKDITERYKICD
ncbi:hypothetical protein HHI36_004249 [Cryptolaemus montrouzieri]|uniref:Uncharacterized protein n=1 Tax=Cryptolaemus montrouzieri TaxID=559131 RepID=A0ABD2NQX3_9CUCU